MPRYSAGVRTGAGPTTLPVISLYAIAAVGGKLVEVGAFNTTAVAVAVNLVRLTTAGTQGTALVEAKYNSDSAAASCTAVSTHSVAPTLGNDLGYRATIGAVVGAGVIWTFGDGGIDIPVGTANGVGLIVSTGTGQVLDAYLVWDE